MVCRKPLHRVLVLLSASLIFFGCDTKQDIRIGDPAPGFSASALRGGPVDLSRYRGKTVVLYFWRNSCCGEGLKRVEPLYRAHRHDDVEVVAINCGDPAGVVASYAESSGVTFTMVPDEHAALAARYHVIGFPTIFLLDKYGVIRRKIMGDIPANQLETVLQRQLHIRKEAEASYEKSHAR